MAQASSSRVLTHYNNKKPDAPLKHVIMSDSEFNAWQIANSPHLATFHSGVSVKATKKKFDPETKLVEPVAAVSMCPAL